MPTSRQRLKPHHLLSVAVDQWLEVHHQPAPVERVTQHLVLTLFVLGRDGQGFGEEFDTVTPSCLCRIERDVCLPEKHVFIERHDVMEGKPD